MCIVSVYTCNKYHIWNELFAYDISIVRIFLQRLNTLWLDVFVREQATQYMLGSQKLGVNTGHTGKYPCWLRCNLTAPKQEHWADLVMGIRADQQSCDCQKILQQQTQENQVKPGSQVSGSELGSSMFMVGHRHTSSKNQGQWSEHRWQTMTRLLPALPYSS